jgi:protein-S-isoprenylcysteine O-methyltransferase Ste14
MSGSVIIILVHQTIFQGMFFAKNIAIRRRLGVPIRGRNREAILSVVFIILFIIISLLLSLFESPFGTFNLIKRTSTLGVALTLLVMNLLVGAASLIGLKDSWRVGVLEDQQTDLIERGIYSFSRNPYFLSYLIMFVAYTVLLQNIILLVLSLVGFAMIHLMVLKEEKHLTALHGENYRQYQKRVPRYIII